MVSSQPGRVMFFRTVLLSLSLRTGSVSAFTQTSTAPSGTAIAAGFEAGGIASLSLSMLHSIRDNASSAFSMASSHVSPSV